MIVQLPFVMNVYVEVDTASGEVVRVVEDPESITVPTFADIWHRDGAGGMLVPPHDSETPANQIDAALKIIADGAEWPAWERGY